MKLTRNISLRIEPRPDGGIRLWSPQVRGLILSGPDPVKVLGDVWPALTALEDRRGRLDDGLCSTGVGGGVRQTPDAKSR